jgi:hypothetical protein
VIEARAPATQAYPSYAYFPRWQAAPDWVEPIADIFRKQKLNIDTRVTANVSDKVLAALTPGLESIGFRVEKGGPSKDRLYRPVFFADNGKPAREYEIDSYDPARKIALEVEAGRSVMGNAIYRDIIQMSLMVGVQYGVIAAPLEYRYNSGGRQTKNLSYRDCRSILDAIWAGNRLRLPFEGMLLMGY